MTQVIRKVINKHKTADGTWEVLHAQTSAAQVVTDATMRFVSDEQINAWTAMAAGTIATETNDGLMSKEHVAALNGVEQLVTDKISAVVNGAPEQFDTLKEIADYLQTHDGAYNALLATVADKATKAELQAHIEDQNNPHGVTAEQVGLGEVDNTSDMNKPVSTAQQAALDGKASLNGATFTAVVKAVTPAADSNGTDVATTAFVAGAVDSAVTSINSSLPKTDVSATEPADAPAGSTWYEIVE